MNVIEVRGLRKSYASFEAVCGIDLSIAKGEIFSLLGPNGAGKTTTVEILEGFRTRNAGEVKVLGFDPATQGRASREWRNRIGIVLQSTSDAGDLTVSETISHFAGYYSRPRNPEEVISAVGLDNKAKDFNLFYFFIVINAGDYKKINLKQYSIVMKKIFKFFVFV